VDGRDGGRADAEDLRESLGMSTWSNGPGDTYAAHSHDFDKLLLVQSGSIDFELAREGRRERVLAGDRLYLPAGTLHSAVVGPRGVTCLETHLPRGALGTEARVVEGWAPERETGSPGAS
jgi:quercetin dioxygenase-like cupin family protein